jgi:hypothetical protein
VFLEHVVSNHDITSQSVGKTRPANRNRRVAWSIPPSIPISGYPIGGIFIAWPVSRAYASRGARTGGGETGKDHRRLSTDGTEIRSLEDMDHPRRVDKRLQ